MKSWHLSGLGLLFSCTTLLKLVGVEPEVPKIELEALTINHLSFQDLQLAVKLKVHNPNSYEIKIEELQYLLHLNGTQAAAGELPEVQILKPKAQQIFNLALRVDLSRLKDLWQQIAERPNQAVQASVSGRLGLRTPIGSYVVPFKEHRPLNLK